MAPKRKKPVKPKAKRHKKTVKKSRPVISASKSRQGARRKIDPQTGKEISRYAFEKKYDRKRRISQKYSNKKYRHKLNLYKLIRDDFIEKKKNEGVKLSKRDAMNSDDLKKIIRGLHSKSPKRKAMALAQTGRITPDQIELYIQKFAGEETGDGEGDE